MSKKNILMVVTSHNTIDANGEATGVWFEEFAEPFTQFRANGFDVTVASPQGGNTPIDPRSEPEGHNFADAQKALGNTHPLDQVDVSNFDALFLPGGHGTMYDFPQKNVGNLVGAFADADKVIAAVCHGPAALANANYTDGHPVVQGKRITSFTNEEETAANLDHVMPFLLESKLRELGADFVVHPMWSDHVEIAGKLVTGQNPQSSKSTAQAVITLLQD